MPVERGSAVAIARVTERDTNGNPVKIAGSSQDITDRKTNEMIQRAITHISESALTAQTIEELSRSVHEAVETLIPAKNFYIALYDSKSGMISFPYHVDELDDDWSPRRLGKGLTSYVIRTGRSLRATPEIFADLEASGEVVGDGARSVEWLGVSLRSKQTVTGVIATQTYEGSPTRITERHANILSVLAIQVASAIERFFAEREIQKFKLGIDRSESPGQMQGIRPGPNALLLVLHGLRFFRLSLFPDHLCVFIHVRIGGLYDLIER